MGITGKGNKMEERIKELGNKLRKNLLLGNYKGVLEAMNELKQGDIIAVPLSPELQVAG